MHFKKRNEQLNAKTWGIGFMVGERIIIQTDLERLPYQFRLQTAARQVVLEKQGLTQLQFEMDIPQESNDIYVLTLLDKNNEAIVQKFVK